MGSKRRGWEKLQLTLKIFEKALWWLFNKLLKSLSPCPIPLFLSPSPSSSLCVCIRDLIELSYMGNNASSRSNNLPNKKLSVWRGTTLELTFWDEAKSKTIKTLQVNIFCSCSPRGTWSQDLLYCSYRTCRNHAGTTNYASSLMTSLHRPESIHQAAIGEKS